MSVTRHRVLVALTSAAAIAMTACDSDGTTSAPADAALTTETSAPGGDAEPGLDATNSGPDSASSAEDPVTSICDDDGYREPPPDDTADIGPAVSAYLPSDPKAFIREVLTARYPLGAFLVAEGLATGGRIGDCVNAFVGDTGSAASVLASLSTVVHECGHFVDLAATTFSTFHYRVTASLAFTCPRIGNGLARSRLNEDPYADLLPEDFYRPVYLDGDPDNATVEGGDQGYDSVLEETLQYINSLATDWAFRDRLQRGQSISARDGLLTFLWYLTRYLRLARTEYPSEYDKIHDSACWREATLTLWGRAWQYLTLTDGEASLGLRDDVLLDLATTPELLAEIDALRDAAGCP